MSTKGNLTVVRDCPECDDPLGSNMDCEACREAAGVPPPTEYEQWVEYAAQEMFDSALDNARDTPQQNKAESYLHSPNALQGAAWEALGDVLYEQIGWTQENDKIRASLLPLVSEALKHNRRYSIPPPPGITKRRLLKRELSQFKPLVDEAVRRIVEYASKADLNDWFAAHSAADLWPGDDLSDWYHAPPEGVDLSDDKVQRDIMRALKKITK